jgi:hypothetical protein
MSRIRACRHPTEHHTRRRTERVRGPRLWRRIRAKPDEIWALDAKHLVGLNWRDNRVVASIRLDAKPSLQAVAVDATGRAFTTVANKDDVRLIAVDRGAGRVAARGLGVTPRAPLPWRGKRILPASVSR